MSDVVNQLIKSVFVGGEKIGEQQLINGTRQIVRKLKMALPFLAADTKLEKVFWFVEPAIRSIGLNRLPANWRPIINGVMEELNQELVTNDDVGKPDEKTKTTPASVGGANKMIKLPKVWMNGMVYPGLGYHGDCPARHQFKAVTKKRKKGKEEEEYQDESPRPGFRPFSFEAFAASGARAPLIEGERENPGDVGELFVPDTCACEELFERDLKLFEEQKAAPSKKGSAAKGGKSVADYIGRAIVRKIPGVDQTKVDRLVGFLLQLSPVEMVALDEIDSDFEFVALASATDLAQFKKLIAASKDRKERGILVDLIGVPASVAHTLVGAIKPVAGSVKTQTIGFLGAIKTSGERLHFEQSGKNDLLREKLARIREEAAEK